MTSHRPTSDSGRVSWRSLWSPLFVISWLALLAAALGLRPAMHAFDEHYRKEPAPIRRPLRDFDVSRLSSFEHSPDADPPIMTREDVGTDEYVWFDLQEKDPQGRKLPASLFVTYYNDPKDKVAHTPEVCYRQEGTVVTEMTTITLDTPGLGPEVPQIEARLLHLQQPKSLAVLIYVFYVNGQFCHDREQVRWTLASPGDRYVYYSKIEVLSDFLPDADPAPELARCKKLMNEALPVLIEDHYPTGESLKHQ